MDNVACGGKDIAEVRTPKQKLGERLKDGHFIMRKWKSIAPELQEDETTMKKEQGIQNNADGQCVGYPVGSEHRSDSRQL